MRFEVPFIKPRFPDTHLIAEDYEAIIESNWFTNFGPKEREFAARIAGYVGDGVVAVTMTNATIALIALIRSALGHGDGGGRIIVPSFTFAAGPEAIEWCGYRPLFVDIEPDGLQPDLEHARQAVAGRVPVVAILLCNTFGIGNSSIEAWEQLAQDAGIPLLVDSAAGFGSRYPGSGMVGTAGAAEVFSFHATKPFAIGEGGAIVTRDLDLADRLQRFQNFGFGTGRGAEALGMNGKLPEIAAAIGLRQFDHFELALDSRRAVLETYRAALDGEWQFPTGIELSSVCFASILASDEDQRDAAFDRLTNAGVEVRRYYSPVVHTHPHFQGIENVAGLEVSEDVARRVLSLPVHQDMSPGDVERVLLALSSGGER